MNKINENSTAYKLRMYRENCGLSQKAIANALGISRATYTYYETGRSQVKLTTLVKIAALLSVDPNVLLPSEPDIDSIADSDPTVPKPIYSLKKDEQNLVLLYRTLNERDKSLILEKLTNMTKGDI